MGEIKPIIFTAVVIGMGILFSPANHASSTSYGCFCGIPELPKAVERASAVFVGEVVEVINPSTSDATAPLPGRLFTIKFKVQQSWKGVDSDEVHILSAQGKYGCFAFPPVSRGEKYLVYAEQAYHNGISQKDRLMITACNRTALVPEPGTRFDDRPSPLEFNRKDASEDLEKLEQMSKPHSDLNLAAKRRT